MRRALTFGGLVLLACLVLVSVAAAATTTTAAETTTTTLTTMAAGATTTTDAAPTVTVTTTAVGGASTTVETTPEGEPICVTCHASVSPEVVRTWRSQNHGQHQVGCPVCHGGHDQDFHPLPLAEVCFGCHDVAKIHGGDFTPSTPGARCMECHTSNVHWLPGPESWFQGGLPPQDLVAGPPPPKVSAATGTVAGVVGALLAVAVGVLLGVVLNRFIRGL